MSFSWGACQNPMADEVKNAGIGYILKNSYRSPTHGIIKRDINFRACQMILDFDGAGGRSSLDHYVMILFFWFQPPSCLLLYVFWFLQPFSPRLPSSFDQSICLSLSLILIANSVGIKSMSTIL